MSLYDLVDLLRSDEPSWRDFAACRGVDPSVFYPNTTREVAKAVAYCQECPVRLSCLEDALDRPSGKYGAEDGIWGGTSARQRAEMVRRRRRRAA